MKEVAVRQGPVSAWIVDELWGCVSRDYREVSMKSRIVILCFATICSGQSRRPEFEVASVKIVDTSSLGTAVRVNLGTIENDKVSFGNATLVDCVRYAWGIASDMQISGPDWTKSREYIYNIIGKAEPGTPREQILAMTRTLLEDRFKLTTHREQREMAHYALVVAKNGPKMRAVPEYPANYQGKTGLEISTQSCRCLRSLTCFRGLKRSGLSLM